MVRHYIKSNRGVLIAGIAILMIGLGLNVIWFLNDPRIMPLHLVNILPGLSMLAVWFLATAFPQKRWFFIVVGLLVVLIGGVFAVLANLGAALWESATTPVRDIARYEEVLRYHDGEVVAHFPSQIPEEATHVTLYYSRPFLQAGSSLKLRYKLPSAELGSVLRQYQPVAERVENGRYDIPKDFIVLYLNPSDPADSNGYAYGVAVSMERQEVIYWAEDMR